MNVNPAVSYRPRETIPLSILDMHLLSLSFRYASSEQAFRICLSKSVVRRQMFTKSPREFPLHL